MNAKKHLYLRTFGCQMNERDSEGVQGLLLDRSFILTDSIEEADVILLNTCSVRQHAEERVFGRSSLLSSLKKRRPDTVIGVLGCMAQEHGSGFFEKMPALDLVCGPGNLSDLPDLIERVFRNREKITATDRLDEAEYSMDGIRYRSHTVKALVNIMSGCDHRCTYCIVPMTRGVERSRPSADVLHEVRALASGGFRDIMLLGQNVNCYGKKLSEGIDFADLLEKIDGGTGVSRLRFTTSHPKDAGEKMFRAMSKCASVCEHLHLPVQSGSNAILRRMKREHTREAYLERVREYRKWVKEGSISTDIMVGFPGETEKDFEETKSLMQKVAYDSAFIFKYSPRPGTPAFKLRDDVPEETKRGRLQELLAMQRTITRQKNGALIGHEVEVLFEETFQKDGQKKAFGRTRTFKKVYASAAESPVGELRKVEITEALNESLFGRILSRC